MVGGDEVNEFEGDDERPVRSLRVRRILRWTAIVSMGLLVVPGLIGTIAQAQRSAAYACELARLTYAPNARTVDASFRLFPTEAAGWQCHVDDGNGGEVLIATLGPIPGLPQLRPVSGT